MFNTSFGIHSFTDQPGEQTFNLAILHDLEHLVHFSTRIPGCLGGTSNNLYLFLTFNPTAYSVKLSFLLGFCGHDLISINCSISPVRP